MCSRICACQNWFPCVWRNIIYFSILQQGFRGTLVFYKTCSGVTWVLRVPCFFRGNDFLLQYVDVSLWKFLGAFRSPCCIQIPSRPVSCTGGWVQLIAKKNIDICCAIRKNVIVAWQLYDIADVQFTVEKEGHLELFAAVLPTLRLSHKFGLVFLWIYGFFWRLACCLFCAFLIKIGLICRFLFADCLNNMALLLFQFTAKWNLGVFLCKFAHLGLFFFQICLPFLYLICLLVLCFLNFLTNASWACFFPLN